MRPAGGGPRRRQDPRKSLRFAVVTEACSLMPTAGLAILGAMIIVTHTQALSTKGRDDCVDITEAVQAAVGRAKIRQGVATVFVTGSTAGVTTIEHEPGLVKDLKDAVRRLFPADLRYAHHESGGDDNGFSHLRASFIGPSLSVPVAEGRLQLGTWQQIVLIDFDVRPRDRTYLIQLLGD